MLTSLDNVLLAQLGLASLEAVRSCIPNHLVKNHGGKRDVLRLELAGHPPFFLKRIWRASKKNGLISLLRHGTVWSDSRQEWHNCQTLQAAGFPTCPLIAFGEETGALWGRFSFILTVAAPGQSLEDFIRTTPPSPLRRQTLDHLARHIRRMHDAGLYSPDLFTRHIFVSLPKSSPSPSSQPTFHPVFSLIDMARLDRSSPASARLAARDLAVLNVTAPPSLVTRTERVRFLRAYDLAGRKPLLRRIARRANILLKRPQFRSFFA